MASDWPRTAIAIPKAYSPLERQAIAQVVIEFIIERTKNGLDKNNRRFARYSKAYTKSLNFRNAGKRKSEVDLTVTGDMLDMLIVLSTSPGQVVIGYRRGSLEGKIAMGNILGTYGKSYQVGPKRDFLGITRDDLRRVLKKFPLDDREKSKTRAKTQNESDKAAAQLAARIFSEIEDE